MTIILLMGTPKKVTPNLRKPLFRDEFGLYLLAALLRPLRKDDMHASLGIEKHDMFRV